MDFCINVTGTKAGKGLCYKMGKDDSHTLEVAEHETPASKRKNAVDVYNFYQNESKK